jgi:hypothetical protein
MLFLCQYFIWAPFFQKPNMMIMRVYFGGDVDMPGCDLEGISEIW